MKRKLSEFDLQAVIFLKFLDTPGDEVAPGSNEVRKNFENDRFRHDHLLYLFRSLNLFEQFKSFKGWRISINRF